MNGYYARVQRHRRMLAEQAARTQEAAVPLYDWICAPVDGITEAVVAAVPHRHGHKSTAEPVEPATPEATGADATGPDVAGQDPTRE
jgi:hypothetical protein